MAAGHFGSLTWGGGDPRTALVLPLLARRVARVAAVGLLAVAAVLSGRVVGGLGQGTRAVRPIAPTGQPVRHQASRAPEAPWPLAEARPATR